MGNQISHCKCFSSSNPDFFW